MLSKLYKAYCRVEDVVVGAGFVSIVALTFMNAVLRQLDRPIIIADDVCLLLSGWVAFLGADVALRYSRLVGMDILVSKFPKKEQKLFQLAVYIVMICALVLFAFYGTRLAAGNWKRFYNSLPISYGWVTLSLPVCSALMILTASVKVFKLLKNFNNDDYDVRKDNPDKTGEEYTGSDEEAL